MIEEVKRQKGVEGRGDVSGVVDRIAQQREEWMGQWEPHFTSNEVPISPYRVLRELQLAVDVDNTIITHDSGYPREQFLPFWEKWRAVSYLPLDEDLTYELLMRESLRGMRDTCLAEARRRFSLSLQAERTLAFYRSLPEAR